MTFSLDPEARRLTRLSLPLRGATAMKMQPTQASKRRRAISDLGALASNRQRFGTQTMGAPVGHDAGTEDVLQGRTLRTSSPVAATNVMQMQPTFAARRVRSCSDPGSLELGAKEVQRPTQREVLSDREDAFAASPMETRSAVSSADLGVLLDTQEATTSDRGSTIDLTVEVSPVEPPGEDSTQPSSQQDTTSAGADSLGGILSTDTCVPPISLKLPRTQKEDFFTHFEGLVPASEFDDFRSTLGRERNFTATIWRSDSGRFVPSAWRTWEYLQSKQSTALSVLLIEDADIRCFKYLSAEFGIDSRFMISYVGYRVPVASFGGRWWRRARLNRYHQSGVDAAPSWYTMNARSCGNHLWHDSKSPSQFAPHSARPYASDHRYWYSNSVDKRPWWQEPRRKVQSDRNCPERSFQTVVACYCLSPYLRKSGLKFGFKTKRPTHADR